VEPSTVIRATRRPGGTDAAPFAALILRMRPKKAPKTAVGAAAEKKVEHQHKFPGLAIPDSKPVLLDPSPPRKRSQSPGAKSSRRDADDDGGGRDRRRSYDDERDRRDSRGGRDDRDRRRDDYDDGDRRDGHRHGDRRERRWEDDRHRDGGGGRAAMPPPVSKEPLLYAVYKGNVSNSMDFGVFITLPQFGRKEGLLHISQITGKGRLLSGKDAFKRGESVWVKVLSVNDNKMSLTMRDVDQVPGTSSTRSFPPSATHAPTYG